jgi:hypothetical protein
MVDLIDEKINFIEKEETIFQKPKKINIILNLKNHKEKDRIKKIITEFTKKQKKDYFLKQNNIFIGKINLRKTFFDKNNKLIPYSFVGPASQFSQISKSKQNNKQKNFNSLSTSRIEKQRNTKDLTNGNNTQIIDNIVLKSYFDEIRKKISTDSEKKRDRNKLLNKVPSSVKKRLICQENIFRRNNQQKKIEKLIEERLKKRTKRHNLSDLLMNRSKDYNSKNQEITIMEKCITNGNKFKNNMWNITLRNPRINGKYEEVGYLNIRDKYDPLYTLFNINSNISFFNKPILTPNKRIKLHNKNNERKINEYSNKKIASFNGDIYDLKTKHNLKILDSIKNLEVSGKSLLDVEEKRESKIKGKKILYNRQEFELMHFKQRLKAKNKKYKSDIEMPININDIYKDKIFAINYHEKDIFKNANLTSKYSSYKVL